MMQFCDDMLSVGEKMVGWLKPGGRIAFVIGNKRLGEKDDAAKARLEGLLAHLPEEQA